VLRRAALLVALAAVLAACGGDPPEAGFTATPTSGETPLTVSFTDTSANDPTGWLWDFGDGATSEGQNPTHVYEAAGTYTVTLTATNGEGSDDMVERDLITVTPPPNPVCASLQGLKTTLGKLTGIDLSLAGLAEVEGIVQELKTGLEELRSAGGEEYGDEISKVQEAYDSVTAAIQGLAESPAGALDEVAAAAADVIAAAAAVESAIGEGCG
jgi:PKD repeat protein